MVYPRGESSGRTGPHYTGTRGYKAIDVTIARPLCNGPLDVYQAGGRVRPPLHVLMILYLPTTRSSTHALAQQSSQVHAQGTILNGIYIFAIINEQSCQQNSLTLFLNACTGLYRI